MSELPVDPGPDPIRPSSARPNAGPTPGATDRVPPVVAAASEAPRPEPGPVADEPGSPARRASTLRSAPAGGEVPDAAPAPRGPATPAPSEEASADALSPGGRSRRGRGGRGRGAGAGDDASGDDVFDQGDAAGQADTTDAAQDPAGRARRSGRDAAGREAGPSSESFDGEPREAPPRPGRARTARPPRARGARAAEGPDAAGPDAADPAGPDTDDAAGGPEPEVVGPTARRRAPGAPSRSATRSGARDAAARAEGAADGGELGVPVGPDDPSRAAEPGAPPGPGEAAAEARNPELPDRHIEGRPKSVEAAERALVPRKPQIGDSMPAPPMPPPAARPAPEGDGDGGREGKRRRRGTRGRGSAKKAPTGRDGSAPLTDRNRPIEQVLYDDEPLELDERAMRRRKGRERKGRPIGRYLMCVHVSPKATQIAVLEGRALVEHYVSRPADDIAEIHGNIYLGKVQNVLPGMEAAFVDIGTPKNAVLYRGDVHYDREDIESPAGGPATRPRIEQVLRARQTILCQVTKNPIAHKGARLTQEVSLPGRFVVLIPNSSTYGISKRLPDNERKRLRTILDRVKPPQHGVIVRTAAEGVTEEEIERDVRRLAEQWEAIDRLAKRSNAPALLYREPDLALRVIREEFNADYRGIVIDDPVLYEEVRSYVAAISPAWADRVELYDRATEPLPLFERFHIHEQRLRALDKKVWLPSGGSLIVEHTEALTVIDVNTGKNVGTSSLEETVFRNNLEAAEEIARQLRLRDIGGIIVIDFVDMEHRDNRDEVIKVFRDALGRDKTRTQVFEISELGLVEMTRKRIGEGLIESVSCKCEHCDGRGLVLDTDLVGEEAT